MPHPRRREARDQIGRDVGEEVTQDDIGKGALGLGGPRSEDVRTSLPCRGDACLPEGRLADPGRTLEHERSRALTRAIEEGANRRQLGVTPDDLGRHGRP